MRIAGAVGTLLLCAAGIAAAQGGTWESEGCVDAARQAPAARCALILLSVELLRGAPASTVSAEQGLSPIPLSRFVRGDSARRYALRYERETRTGLVLRFAGGVLLLGQSIAIHTGGVHLVRADGKANRRAMGVVFTGLGLVGASYPVRWLAMQDGERAVAAHNSGLAR